MIPACAARCAEKTQQLLKVFEKLLLECPAPPGGQVHLPALASQRRELRRAEMRLLQRSFCYLLPPAKPRRISQGLCESSMWAAPPRHTFPRAPCQACRVPESKGRGLGRPACRIAFLSRRRLP